MNELIINDKKYNVKPDGNYIFDDMFEYLILQNKSQKTGHICLALVDILQDISGVVILPKEVTDIGIPNAAVKHIERLDASLLIGANVSTIHEWALRNSNIKKVCFPNLTTIENYAFYESKINYLPDFSKINGTLTGFLQCDHILGCQTIENGNIKYEDGIIRIPKNIKTVNTFVGASNRKAYHDKKKFDIIFSGDEGSVIVLSSAFMKIGINEIKGLQNYKEVKGAQCFSGSEIENVTVEDNFKATYGFDSAKITNLTDNRKIITKGSYSLADICYKKFSNTETIEPYAFYGSHIENISFKNKLKTVGTDAFGGCVGLTSIEVNADEYGDKAFQRCYDAKHIVLNQDAKFGASSVPFIYSGLNLDVNQYEYSVCVLSDDGKRDFALKNLNKYKEQYYLAIGNNPYAVFVGTKEEAFGARYQMMSFKHELEPGDINLLKQYSTEYHPDCKYAGLFMFGFGFKLLLDIKDGIDYSFLSHKSIAPHVKYISKKQYTPNDEYCISGIVLFRDECQDITVGSFLAKNSDTIIFPSHVKKIKLEFEDNESPSRVEKIYLPDTVEEITSSKKQLMSESNISFYITAKTDPNIVKAFADSFGYSPDSGLKIILTSNNNHTLTIPYDSYLRKAHTKGLLR